MKESIKEFGMKEIYKQQLLKENVWNHNSLK